MSEKKKYDLDDDAFVYHFLVCILAQCLPESNKGMGHRYVKQDLRNLSQPP